LVHNAFHDMLTGLPNRALLYERLAQEIDGGGEFAVLSLDLDGFESVDDELGHAVGDSVLRAAGDAMYSAKVAGRNGYRTAGTSGAPDVRRRRVSDT
jgi:diguanylate cyclase (GGDEF)-like protein